MMFIHMYSSDWGRCFNFHKNFNKLSQELHVMKLCYVMREFIDKTALPTHACPLVWDWSSPYPPYALYVGKHPSANTNKVHSPSKDEHPRHSSSLHKGDIGVSRRSQLHHRKAEGLGLHFFLKIVNKLFHTWKIKKKTPL